MCLRGPTCLTNNNPAEDGTPLGDTSPLGLLWGTRPRRSRVVNHFWQDLHIQEDVFYRAALLETRGSRLLAGCYEDKPLMKKTQIFEVG